MHEQPENIDQLKLADFSMNHLGTVLEEVFLVPRKLLELENLTPPKTILDLKHLCGWESKEIFKRLTWISNAEKQAHIGAEQFLSLPASRQKILLKVEDCAIPGVFASSDYVEFSMPRVFLNDIWNDLQNASVFCLARSQSRAFSACLYLRSLNICDAFF